MKLNRILSIIALVGITIVIGTILYASQLYWPKVADDYPETRFNIIVSVLEGGFVLLPLLASAIWATRPRISVAKKSLGTIGCMALAITGYIAFYWGPDWIDDLRGHTNSPMFYCSVNAIPETALAMSPFLLVTLATAILTLRKSRKTPAAIGSSEAAQSS
ncbi:hypothetical protein [Actinotignum sp. GS-2025a]|uniref:hypothetical protein n=1 Tax=Actinotignum sp. GS-2025a TaxID=3427274 RepID=UPI003F45E5F1